MDSAPLASTHSDSPLLMESNASAMDFMPEAQAMLTVYAGTSFGTPLRMEIWRAGLGPPPAWRALPKMVCWTCSGAMPARSMAALAAMAPISAAVNDASEPPNLPIGVRTAERIRTEFTVHSLQ